VYMAAHTAPGGGLDVLDALLAGRRELAQLLGAPSWAHYQVSVELLVAADRVAPLQHAPCSCELQRLAALLHARRIRAHQHA